MTAEVITQLLDLWISRYIALFCLVTLFIWAGGSYLLQSRWKKSVRDASLYLGVIGVLTLSLAFRPVKTDTIFWTPMAWFCFAMLLMMELFWLTFVIDAGIRAFRKLASRVSQSLAKSTPSSEISQYHK